METKNYKELFKELLSDYLEIKKLAIELGYNDPAFNFKDYLDTFNKLNSNPSK